METFLEYETMCREAPPGHVFVESLAEIDQRKVAEVVRRTHHKKQRLCDPFFRALSETHSAISLETCKDLVFSSLNSTCQGFIQIYPSFRDLLAKTTFPANKKCFSVLFYM